MVKAEGQPGGGSVTGTTTGSKAAMVEIILPVAKITVLRSGFEFHQGEAIDVALTAWNLGMFSS